MYLRNDKVFEFEFPTIKVRDKYTIAFCNQYLTSNHRRDNVICYSVMSLTKLSMFF